MSDSVAAPSPNLSALPDELLLEILNHIDQFPPVWRTRSLYGLSLANRRLHGITESYLYSTISFYAGVPYLFLRTICLDPHLASQVKVIRWDYDTSASERFAYKPGVLAVKLEFPIDDARAKLEDMAKQGDPLAKELASNLEVGRLYLGDHRALEVMLMFTPNVEHIEVSETWRWDDHAYWFLPIICRPSRFSQLTSATIQGEMRPQNIRGLLLLPSMRRLELSRVIDMRHELGRTLQWEDPQAIDLVDENLFSQRSSYVEHLQLLDSCTELDEFKRFLCGTQDLKSFTYEHRMNDLSRRISTLPVSDLIELLKPHWLTLTSIRILDLEGMGSLFWDSNEFFIFVWLSESLEQVLEWEKLPPKLESLVLDFSTARDFDEDRITHFKIDDRLTDLVELRRRDESLTLKSLEIKNWHPFYGIFPRNTLIGEKLKDVGIQLISRPANKVSSLWTTLDIGWVELQSEPGWVILEFFHHEREEGVTGSINSDRPEAMSGSI